MTQRHLRVGFVAGVHGIRGALRLRLYDPGSDAIARAHALWLHRDDAAIGRHEIEHAAAVPGRAGELRVTLVGVEDRTRAEALVGAEVAIDRAELPPLDDDEYYLADVLGATVERVGDGA